jgi:hypothetical protein
LGESPEPDAMSRAVSSLAPAIATTRITEVPSDHLTHLGGNSLS